MPFYYPCITRVPMRYSKETDCQFRLDRKVNTQLTKVLWLNKHILRLQNLIRTHTYARQFAQDSK